MIDFQEVERQLPAYLNYDAKKRLFSDLTQFPDNIDERLYTTYLKAALCLFQGDGLKDMLFVDLPSLNKKEVDAMILSNSCDIDPKNERFFPLNVVYAPIVSLQRYVDLLISQEVGKAKVEDHVNSIKRQEVSHIFYLPKVDLLYESIVFLDKVNSCNINYFIEKKLTECRLFTLSDYGFFLFIFKLSVHFMRFRERMQRKAV